MPSDCLLRAHGLNGSEDIDCLEVARQSNGQTMLTIHLASEPALSIVFRDLVRVRIPEFYRNNLSFGEAVLDDVAAEQLEGIRYRLTDELEAWLIESGSVSFETPA